MDPIADMFTRIRNAQAVQKETVFIPHSKAKMEIAKVLVSSGFIKSASRKGRKTKRGIEIELLYEDNNSRIGDIKRVSKPSRRVYLGYRDLRVVRQGRGVAIISTPKGVMTDREARKKKLGGEIIGEVW